MTDQRNREAYDSILGEHVAEHFEGLQHDDDKFRAQQEQAQSQIQSARADLMNGFMRRRKKPEYPQEIVDIANTLKQQPFMIGPVQKFIAKLAKEVSNAIDGVVSDLVEPLGSEEPKTEAPQ